MDFDVFLSHNSRDKPTVIKLAEALKERGLYPWLDIWELVPGRPWQDALEEIIETVPSAAVLVGQDGLGPWEKAEMRGFLTEFADRKLPVIPVLLPGTPYKPELPLFLRAFTWVDLRGSWSQGIDRLVWGITGQKSLACVTEDEITSICPLLVQSLPFLSLGPLFKGREDHLIRLAADLEINRTAAIVQPQVIHGLGGIGKTRLAVEYAWRSGSRYSAAFFVQAETPAQLRSGLFSLF